MSKQFELYNKVFSIYQDMVIESEGLITTGDIKKIRIPTEYAKELYQGDISSFELSGEHIILDNFRNAEITLSNKFELEK